MKVVVRVSSSFDIKEVFEGEEVEVGIDYTNDGTDCLVIDIDGKRIARFVAWEYWRETD